MELNADYFKTIQGTMGCSNKKQAKVAEIQKRFARDFDSSIGVVYDATRNDVPQDFIITKSSKDVIAFTRPNEELNIGDIVFWNNFHWLVTDKPFHNEIYNSGVIIRCNREIKWQNPVTKEVISRWCFAERPYATGITEGSVMSIPDRVFRIKLPYDLETTQVDIGKRFVLENINGNQIVYELEMPDLNTNKFQDSEGGFIVWNLKYANFIDPSRDNVELGICDYIAPSLPLLPDVGLESFPKCEIVGSDNIKIGGAAKKYVAKFYLDNDIEEYNMSPTWDITIPPRFDKYFEITKSDNYFLIKVLDNDCLINEQITLALCDTNELCQPITKTISLVVV